MVVAFQVNGHILMVDRIWDSKSGWNQEEDNPFNIHFMSLHDKWYLVQNGEK